MSIATIKKKECFSVRLKEDLLNKIGIIAQEKQWSRNQTIAYMLEEQVKGNSQEKSNEQH